MSQQLSQIVGVADPLYPTHALKPNADGSINVVGGGGGGTVDQGTAGSQYWRITPPGPAAPIVVAQTVTAASAYASGNCIGGKITFAGAQRANGVGALIQSAVVNFKSAQTGAMELWLFNADPSASTITDKTAFVVAAADSNKVIAAIPITASYAGNVASVMQALALAVPINIAGATTIYGALVTRTTPTFTATTDVSVTLSTIWN